MDDLFNSFSWDDIYSCWRLSTGEDLSIVNNYPAVCRLNVQYGGKGRIYCHFWLESKQIYSLVNEFSKMVNVPQYQQNIAFSDVRVVRSTELMIQSINEEERAAIWLFVFCDSLENADLPYPNSLLIDYVGAKARDFLQGTYQEWLFRYHHRFPKLYINQGILKNVVFENFRAVIDYAILNAFMICKNYTFALFASDLENKCLLDGYQNLRKNI